MEEGEERIKPTVLKTVESSDALASVLGPLIEGLRYDIALEALHGLGEVAQPLLDIPHAILNTLGATSLPATAAVTSDYQVPQDEIIIQYDES
jgi:hypothetical protein